MKPSLKKNKSTAATGWLSQISSNDESILVPWMELFDDLPQVVFFIKDREGRYQIVSQTLVDRCGVRDRSVFVGKRPEDLFPTPLASRYQVQDERVLRSGKSLVNQLELHLYPIREPGWCLTNKYPVRAAKSGEITGIVGISRDIETQPGGETSSHYPELAQALEYIHEHLADPLSIDSLAKLSELTVYQFESRIRRLFYMSPKQLVMKIRIQEVVRLLGDPNRSLVDIAAATGFCDQSALTKSFRRLVGVTPGIFRSHVS